jgi:hypothetical protein
VAKQTIKVHIKKPKVKRAGVHAKTKNSKLKSSTLKVTRNKVDKHKNKKNTKCDLKRFLSDLTNFSFILTCNTFFKRTAFLCVGVGYKGTKKNIRKWQK